jgi:hypothetical protein
VTQDELETWNKIFDASGDPSELVVRHRNIEISRRKMRCMKLIE